MSGVIGDLPLTISDSVLRLMPSAFAVSVTESPSGASTSSRRFSPGCGGLSMGILGAFEIPHQLDELAEQIMTVARPRRGFGVGLHREDWPILKGNAAI